MNKDDLIRENLKKVREYGRNIQNKKFIVPYDHPDTELGKMLFSIARNEMARALIFQMYWRNFNIFASKCNDHWTPEQEDKSIELLHFIIKIYEANSESWELFWQGKQPDDPSKMSFIMDGEDEVTYIDLTEIKEITVGHMGC